MICRNISCHREIEDGSKYCPYCGTPQQTSPRAPERNPFAGHGRSSRAIPFSEIASVVAIGIASIIFGILIFKYIGGHEKRKWAREERIERKIQKGEKRMREFERLDPDKFDWVEDFIAGTPGFGDVKVTSNPQGAKIYLDGKYTGRKTPAQVNIAGKEKMEIRYKSHSVISEFDAYSYKNTRTLSADFSSVVRKTDKINREAGSKYDWVDEWLNTLTTYGDVEITSDPPGAKIYLDGDYIGKKTPSTVNITGAEKIEVKYNKWEFTKDLFPESYKDLKKLHVDYTPLM